MKELSARLVFTVVFLLFAATPLRAQESGGLLAVPAPVADSPAVPESSFPSASPDPGAAQLNISPIQVEEDTGALPVPKNRPGTLDGLRIEEGEEKKSETWWMTDIFDKLPRSLRDDLLRQSGDAQRYCEQNFMLGNFYDCECYGVAVLKDLVLEGGESKNIAYNTEDERFKACVDTGRIAGFAYNRCHQSLILLEVSDQMLEDICSCTARSLARDYKRTPIANLDRADRIYNELLVECRQNASLTGVSPRKNP